MNIQRMQYFNQIRGLLNEADVPDDPPDDDGGNDDGGGGNWWDQFKPDMEQFGIDYLLALIRTLQKQYQNGEITLEELLQQIADATRGRLPEGFEQWMIDAAVRLMLDGIITQEQLDDLINQEITVWELINDLPAHVLLQIPLYDFFWFEIVPMFLPPGTDGPAGKPNIPMDTDPGGLRRFQPAQYGHPNKPVE